jgi:hypothetical protein
MLLCAGVIDWDLRNGLLDELRSLDESLHTASRDFAKAACASTEGDPGFAAVGVFFLFSDPKQNFGPWMSPYILRRIATNMFFL